MDAMLRAVEETLRATLNGDFAALEHALAGQQQTAATVPWTSVLSARSQKVLRLVRREHKQNAMALRTLTRRYVQGESLLGIARSLQFPAYSLVRLIVPELVPEVRTNPKLLKSLAKVVGERDPRLVREVAECEDADLDTAPAQDYARRIAGLEYEFKLQRELHAAGILFEAEGALRVRGYAKTPDILLPIPLGISSSFFSEQRGKMSSSSAAGVPATRSVTKIIHWIDSKAMFGDLSTHKHNLEQIQSYVNRFGEGLVIYWFGFDPTILNTSHVEVLIAREFPVLHLVNY